jgi:hypothetical protein
LRFEKISYTRGKIFTVQASSICSLADPSDFFPDPLVLL